MSNFQAENPGQKEVSDFIKKRRFHFCSFCKIDLTLSCQISCTECDNVVLCVDCFCSGINFDSHLSSHGYKVSDSLDFPIFTTEWTASEELLLLEGIEKCGMGNWKAVADFIGSKTVKQVEDHYWDDYMGKHGLCLPSTIIYNSKDISKEDFIQLYEDPSIQASLHECSTCTVNEGYLSREEVLHRDKGKETHLKSKQDIKERNASLPGGDLPGFLPLREDFDIEYDNDAELLLADLEFYDDDHPTEKDLKYQILSIYNHKLEERQLRKRFAIDRGLVDFKKHQLADRKKSKEEKDLVARLRMFARFQTPEEHEALIEGILRARKLRIQIDAFQQYRRMGIRTLEEAREYDIERRKKETENKIKKHQHMYFNEVGTSITATSSSSSNNAIGGSYSNTMTATTTTSSRRTLIRRGGGGFSSQEGLSQSHENDITGTTTSSSSSSSSSTTNTTTKKNSSTKNANATTTTSSSANDVKNIFSSAPGAELLSIKELDFCQVLPILPLHYVAIKEAIIREAYRNRTLTLEGVKRIIRLDITAQTKIFDFFIRDLNVPLYPYKTLDSSTNATLEHTDHHHHHHQSINENSKNIKQENIHVSSMNENESTQDDNTTTVKTPGRKRKYVK